MAKSKKPYSGMGAWVVITEDYPGVWGVYRGAATLEQAAKYRRQLSHWPEHKVQIVPNTEA